MYMLYEEKVDKKEQLENRVINQEENKTVNSNFNISSDLTFLNRFLKLLQFLKLLLQFDVNLSKHYLQLKQN